MYTNVAHTHRAGLKVGEELKSAPVNAPLTRPDLTEVDSLEARLQNLNN